MNAALGGGGGAGGGVPQGARDTVRPRRRTVRRRVRGRGLLVSRNVVVNHRRVVRVAEVRVPARGGAYAAATSLLRAPASSSNPRTAGRLQYDPSQIYDRQAASARPCAPGAWSAEGGTAGATIEHAVAAPRATFVQPRALEAPHAGAAAFSLKSPHSTVNGASSALAPAARRRRTPTPGHDGRRRGRCFLQVARRDDDGPITASLQRRDAGKPPIVEDRRRRFRSNQWKPREDREAVAAFGSVVRVDASTPRGAETMAGERLLEERLPARFEEPTLENIQHVCGAQRVRDEGRLPSAACEPPAHRSSAAQRAAPLCTG